MLENKGIKIYISGPMTGLPEFNRPLFNKVEKELKAVGFNNITNPAQPPKQESRRDNMRQDIKALCECDLLVTLPNWRQSKGATLEVQVAQEIGTGILAIEDFFRLEARS
ncbi:MAG: DUF4406 domain-containing protein [Lentisphaeraceae bacterium]|nr:DUF4406 domain-containing protein [Lentisphaeraceae bacterium]